jgi:hypothetical protein
MALLAPLVRHLGIASLAGLVAGFFAAGILGRIAMRVSGFTSRPELIGVHTSNGNRVGEITVGGTLAIAFFVGIFAGIVGGIFYAAAEPWLRSRRWKGLIFGVGLLLALGYTLIDPSNFDFERFGFAPLNVLMFASIFVAFGAATAFLYDAIRGLVERKGPISRGIEGLSWLAALAALAVAALSVISVGDMDLEEVPFLLPFAAAAIVPPIVLWRRLPRLVGYAGFALPVLVGGVRTLTGVIQLVD